MGILHLNVNIELFRVIYRGYVWKLGYLLQIGQADEKFFDPAIKGNHDLGVVLHRLAADYHPVAKLGMMYMVAVLEFQGGYAGSRVFIPGIAR